MSSSPCFESAGRLTARSTQPNRCQPTIATLKANPQRCPIDPGSDVYGEIELFSTRIASCLRPLLEDDMMDRLDEVPGVNRRTVENVIAEIGPGMGQFPDENHLSS